MRYFTATAELFDALRDTVMQQLGQPNAKAEQPWPAGITSLALCHHEYSPPQYAALIGYALANGAQEISAEEYQDLQPKPMLHTNPPITNP